jgi:mannose/fructose/N-acetylgalactosamine-specific phosphotransferase system component IID
MTRGGLRALVRLLTVQASFTFERLQGVGIAAAQEPLLEPLGRDTDAGRQARSRSAQYFNAHPFLASIAVGALARAELDRVDGDRIQRLRTALSGPLGALGDQLFWAGIVPALMGLMLVACALGWGLPALVAVVIAYNGGRILLTAWGLRFGLAHGAEVAGAIGHTRLREMAQGAGILAAVMVGGAIPRVAAWLIGGAVGEGSGWLGALLLGGAVAVGLLTRRRPVSAPLITLGAAAAVLLWRGGAG